MHRLARIHASQEISSNRGRTIVYGALVAFLALYLGTVSPASELRARYASLQESTWRDRNGIALSSSRNVKGNFLTLEEDVPYRFEQLLLQKEDRYFYYHLGVNPISMLRGLILGISSGKAGGSSTITQQLVKIVLGNEKQRTIGNKLAESFYAVALELHASKREILTMYENSVYFGKNREGLAEASRYFFGKKTSELTESEMLQLITALGAPSSRFPGSPENVSLLPAVVTATKSDLAYEASSSPSVFPQPTSLQTPFELKTLHLSCDPCDFTVDTALTEKIRNALRRHIESASKANVHNGAVVVIKLPENELLSLVGSPNPGGMTAGAQLNMAIEPRPIGSTAKPFIYLSAFMKGARPYTLVDDKEYSYNIGTGFAFYPKNFDGKFRGVVTLHNALSNSLNVPAVKTLEYVGLPRFYDFLRESLGFTSKQPLERYELGIALGALEMDLLTLSHYFTIFPQGGVLKPLTLEKTKREGFHTPMEKKSIGEKRVGGEAFVQLVNRILSDRETAVEQFGLRSNLTLPYKNYALKTGTSGNYHDSWTIGFTPDFLVGVWLGNSDNSAMRELTGESGAGAVWQDVMTLLYTSSYNHETPFRFDKLKEFTDSGSIEYGFLGDDYGSARNLLTETSFIVTPHEGDTIEWSSKTIIPLKAQEAVDWFVNGVFLAHAKEVSFSPKKVGTITIEAKGVSCSQTIRLSLTKEI